MRDQFAMAAMHALLSGPAIRQYADRSVLAQDAYKIADAMMEESHANELLDLKSAPIVIEKEK